MRLMDLHHALILMSVYYDDLVLHYEEVEGEPLGADSEATFPITGDTSENLLVESLESKFRFYCSKTNNVRIRLHTLHGLVKDVDTIDWPEVYRFITHGQDYIKTLSFKGKEYLKLDEVDISHFNISLLKRDTVSLLHRLQRPIQKTIAIMDSLTHLGILASPTCTHGDLIEKLNEVRPIVEGVDDLVTRLWNSSP